jgi:hypothetical protein
MLCTGCRHDTPPLHLLVRTHLHGSGRACHSISFVVGLEQSGTQEFLHALEESMDRRLVPQKGGRPAKARPDARQSDLDFGL